MCFFVMSKIKFGPGGLGPVKDAVKNLEVFYYLGLRVIKSKDKYSMFIDEARFI